MHIISRLCVLPSLDYVYYQVSTIKTFPDAQKCINLQDIWTVFPILHSSIYMAIWSIAYLYYGSVYTSNCHSPRKDANLVYKKIKLKIKAKKSSKTQNLLLCFLKFICMILLF